VARTLVCRVGFSRHLRFLSNPADHRLKPMLQAETRATAGCPIPGAHLLSVFLTQETSLLSQWFVT